MTLWTSGQAEVATGGRATRDWAATGISIDSRSLQPGDLFVALSAARDGHDFVAQALDKGAAAAMVSRVPDDVASGAPLLVVEDVQAGLEALGRAGRGRTGARVLAVTGSVGKTSTKEMLAGMLAGQGRTHASVASYNNQWGVPLTLARMPVDTEYAVIEIGMNHPGEIAPLAAMTRPHVALITTVAAAHLEAFDDLTAIAREKAAVFGGLEPGGVAVVNGDLEVSGILKEVAQGAGARVVSFGEAPGCDHRALEIEVTAQAAVVRAEAADAPLFYKLAAPGRHFALNALGALAALAALGADPALAALDLGRWAPVAGRGARETVLLDPVEKLSLGLIDDSYNANPASMAAALEMLAATPIPARGGRRIAVLGDMKELGGDELALHAALADLPAMAHIDRVDCAGPLMWHLHQVLDGGRRGKWAETSAGLLSELPRSLRAGDMVLVKGSLSMDMAVLVDGIRKMGHPAFDPDLTHDDE